MHCQTIITGILKNSLPHGVDQRKGGGHHPSHIFNYSSRASGRARPCRSRIRCAAHIFTRPRVPWEQRCVWVPATLRVNVLLTLTPSVSSFSMDTRRFCFFHQYNVSLPSRFLGFLFQLSNGARTSKSIYFEVRCKQKSRLRKPCSFVGLPPRRRATTTFYTITFRQLFR